MTSSTPLLRRVLTLCTLACLLWTLPASASPLPNQNFDPQRAKLLGYIVSQHLTRHHYSHKSLDDDLSVAAFDLYLKQLDAQKRFLLTTDVKMLGAYESYIDNEIRRGEIHLPIYSAQIMAERIPVVENMIEELLAKPFNFTLDEQLETDNKKLEFCRTDQELKERWRKILKFQVANRYLDLKEEQEQPAAESDSAEKASTDTPAKKLSDDELRQQAREKVAKRYQHLMARMLKEKEDEHFDRYLNAISRAYDPHSNYLPPAQKEDFDIHMRGSLEGIGALLREEDGYIKVVSLIPGGAAEQEGQLESEDTILKVAEGDQEPVDITDTRIRDAVSLIRGPKGTEVRLHVKKADGSRRIISIVREVVQIKETFVKSTVITPPDSTESFGYLKIPSFYRDFKNGDKNARNVTRDTRLELEKLRKSNINGLIIDLRNNGGGSLSDAVDTTGLFIKKGPVVQVKDSTGDIQVLADEDPKQYYDGPIIVLVNKFSASASEILAGALQDYHRAIIVGSKHTHGKGTVQAVLDLDDNLPFRNMEQFKPLGALKITVQKFYRVSGGSTQYRGIVPDIILPDRFEAVKSGEQYIDYSLPWDTIQSSDYKPLAMQTPLLHLQKSSSERVADDPDMQRIAKQAEEARERIENTRHDLTLAAIRAERHAFEAEKEGMPGSDNASDQDDDWQQQVNEDPYVHEGMAIIHDLLTLS
ncbi:carboxy terminal-processing peptidase [Desulfuromonas acetoxidans]|uniref:Carboxyl-terminal protease n=1 Tax=Desulfuromonas acetoxidans (strain DSM 684 / 11070) TaxID=281689 RepID=Q1K3T3_DESA6|nr:carboxy terminal-processing peptidase [Desulfuromonas acetoxidans]EAT17370.1 carboxyl-terminal protease [Desulfuromonas acetoxidans DSM 684]MBF0644247.1 carboxy terminal-processing peptidase [Desulfuromonas acetoxidans]NVD24883.1 carboxy terminal-processing peptidase [Desulfuromonas acetoxidans]NVE15184.1 carboxy terminal-processing peptidase [Desulfuromonas acetoxidans]